MPTPPLFNFHRLRRFLLRIHTRHTFPLACILLLTLGFSAWAEADNATANEVGPAFVEGSWKNGTQSLVFENDPAPVKDEEATYASLLNGGMAAPAWSSNTAENESAPLWSGGLSEALNDPALAIEVEETNVMAPLADAANPAPISHCTLVDLLATDFEGAPFDEAPFSQNNLRGNLQTDPQTDLLTDITDATAAPNDINLPTAQERATRFQKHLASGNANALHFPSGPRTGRTSSLRRPTLKRSKRTPISKAQRWPTSSHGRASADGLLLAYSDSGKPHASPRWRQSAGQSHGTWLAAYHREPSEPNDEPG